MLLDTLPDSKKQAQPKLTLDTLLKNKKPLAKEARYYLDTSRQEGKSKDTITLYGIVLRDYLNYNLAVNPDAHDIRNFLISLQDRKLKPSSVHVYYRTLKAFFNFLVREEILTRSPMVNIKAPKLPKVIIHPFSLEDIKRMLVVCGGRRFYDVRSRALILVFLDTGVRLFDMSGMKRSDYNANTGMIRVMGKGGKERVVPVGRNTQRALARYLFMRDDDLRCLVAD